MKVLITNKKTGSSILIPGQITSKSLNEEVTESNYYGLAWESAVEDGLVSKESRQEDYNFELGHKND